MVVSVWLYYLVRWIELVGIRYGLCYEAGFLATGTGSEGRNGKAHSGCHATHTRVAQFIRYILSRYKYSLSTATIIELSPRVKHRKTTSSHRPA